VFKHYIGFVSFIIIIIVIHCVKGPALYVYNDGVFNDKDWEGLRTLHESNKEDNPMKVGRFGLGFKSVFHMTGMITFKYLDELVDFWVNSKVLTC